MALKHHLYALGTQQSAQDWMNILPVLTGATLTKKTAEKSDILYLDTFDWALFQNDTFLCAHQNGHVDLHWTSPDNILPFQTQLSVDKVPAIASDLPEGGMRKKLDKILGLRALLPMISLQAQTYQLVIADENQQTQVRLSLQKLTQKPGGRKKDIPLGFFLRAEGLAGYETAFDETIQRLDNLAGISRCDEAGLLETALKNIGRVPCDYSSKLKIQLERDMRSDVAAKEILLNQLDQIERNIEGTVADWDSEFLHDLRVAVRRSRSAMSRLKGVLPQTVQDRFAVELAWVGSITTPVRDLDVYMIDYPKYRDQLRDDLQADLLPFYDYVCSQHGAAREQLVKDLGSKRFKDFLSKWRAFLKRPVPARPTAPMAGFTIGVLADKRIWKTYRRVIAEGSVIDDDTPAEALHDLRKTCKKLRYLLEFFASLYPPKKVAGLVKTLKGLQENLGDFQDLDVQADSLHEYSEQMLAAGKSTPRVFMAMGVLVENFMIRKGEVRDEFSERFKNFASKAVEKEFRALVGREKTVKVNLSL